MVLEVHSEAAPPLPPPKDTPQKRLTFKDGAEARHTLLMLLVEADPQAPPQKTPCAALSGNSAASKIWAKATPPMATSFTHFRRMAEGGSRVRDCHGEDDKQAGLPTVILRFGAITPLKCIRASFSMCRCIEVTLARPSSAPLTGAAAAQWHVHCIPQNSSRFPPGQCASAVRWPAGGSSTSRTTPAAALPQTYPLPTHSQTQLLSFPNQAV